MSGRCVLGCFTFGCVVWASFVHGLGMFIAASALFSVIVTGGRRS